MVKRQKGFTIIEVVLVLAIAGLIFLMVLTALPPLQRGQRDQARRGDVGVVAAAVNTFRTNNRGGFGSVAIAGPGNLNSDNLRAYVDRLDQYEVSQVSVMGAGAQSSAPVHDQIFVVARAKCPATMPAPGSSNISLTAGSTRSAAVVARLENNGSTHVFYCQDV